MSNDRTPSLQQMTSAAAKTSANLMSFNNFNQNKLQCVRETFRSVTKSSPGFRRRCSR